MNGNNDCVVGNDLTITGKLDNNVIVGDMYSYEASLSQPLTDAGTYYAIRDLATRGTLNVTSTPLTSQFTILYEGCYDVSFHMSASASKACEIHTSLHINTVHQNYSSETRTIATPNDIGDMSFFGTYDLSVGDVVDLRVKSDAADTNLAIDKLQYRIKRLGVKTGQHAPQT